MEKNLLGGRVDKIGLDGVKIHLKVPWYFITKILFEKRVRLQGQARARLGPGPDRTLPSHARARSNLPGQARPAGPNLMPSQARQAKLHRMLYNVLLILNFWPSDFFPN